MKIDRVALPTQAVLQLPHVPPPQLPRLLFRVVEPDEAVVMTAGASSVDTLQSMVVGGVKRGLQVACGKLQHHCGGRTVVHTDVEHVHIAKLATPDLPLTDTKRFVFEHAHDHVPALDMLNDCTFAPQPVVLYLVRRCSDTAHVMQVHPGGTVFATWCGGGVSHADPDRPLLESIATAIADTYLRLAVPLQASIGFAAPPASLHLAMNVVVANPHDAELHGFTDDVLQQRLLHPISDALASAGVLVTSAVQHHAYATLVDQTEVLEDGTHVLTERSLESFITSSGQWDSYADAGAMPRAKVLRVVLCIPPAEQSPLFVAGGSKLPSNTSLGSSFLVHDWGGVVVLNLDRNPSPSNLSLPSNRHASRLASMMQLRSVVRLLVGLRERPGQGLAGPQFRRSPLAQFLRNDADIIMPWEKTALSQAWFVHTMNTARASLVETVCLARDMAHMRVSQTLADHVSSALAMHERACSATSVVDAVVSAHAARVRAQHAELDPDMVPQLYFPIEHLAAVYAPFLLPLALPLLIGSCSEGKAWWGRRHEQ